MSSLQDRLDEFKKVFESGAPPHNVPREAIEMMHRATAELKASGKAESQNQLPHRIAITSPNARQNVSPHRKRRGRRTGCRVRDYDGFAAQLRIIPLLH